MPEAATVRVDREGDRVTVVLDGRLDATTTGRIWREVAEALDAAPVASLRVDASRLAYCDLTGLALMLELRRRVPGLEIDGLPKEAARLAELLPGGLPPPPPPHRAVGFVERVGRAAAAVARDLVALVGFTGELTVELARAAVHPRSVRWRDAARVAEAAGVDALPIAGLVGFLIGVILAFQGAQVLRTFGAELFVADSVGMVLIRELGPLMTAILLAGRSGAAFAAELGTMKVNEEINALTTMGLAPVRFLVVPRVIAGVAVMPLISLYFTLAGLAGGALVYGGLGFPFVTYVRQIAATCDPGDLVGGLVKAFCFGVLVVAVGCLRGLQAGAGPGAVGLAATRAVVSGLVLIILADGVLSVLYYALGV
jgi:phospholipid/cholesterol/gamma-HCH transport system permease protein